MHNKTATSNMFTGELSRRGFSTAVMKSVGCWLLNQLSQIAVIALLSDFVLTANLSATQSV